MRYYIQSEEGNMYGPYPTYEDAWADADRTGGRIVCDNENEERWPRGTMVFWTGRFRPHWVLEWQPQNGTGCYWIIDSAGTHATALPDELSLYPNT